MLTKAEIVQVIQSGEARNIHDVDLLPLVRRTEMMYYKDSRGYVELIRRVHADKASTILVVANYDKEKAFIERNDSDGNKTTVLLANKEHPSWITIEIKSKIGYVPTPLYEMEPCSVKCQLHYDKKEEKFLISKSNFIRFPEYEE